MSSLTKWISASALAVGIMFALDAPEAKAQHGCYGYGGSGFGISIGRYSSFRPIYGGYGYSRFPIPSYGYGGRSFYHDTTHLDWHPTEIRRHGNHYHVQPGHYDVHRTGHWHH